MSETNYSRRRAVQAAKGEIPFDLLLTQANIVDMVTGEIRAADIGIVDSLIASVHPTGSRSDAKEIHDLNGYFISPGAD
ncbi:Adenine deaminase 2 [Providencia stuartii]|nr:Adenine deaminase 2 [Providencia stuartii]